MRGNSEKGIKSERASSKAKKNIDGTERERTEEEGGKNEKERERERARFWRRSKMRGQKDGMKN